MSIQYEIRLRNLEREVEKLSAMLKELTAKGVTKKLDDPGGFYVKRGFQGFYVYQGDEKVNDRPLKQDDAQKMADEMNGALENVA